MFLDSPDLDVMDPKLECFLVPRGDTSVRGSSDWVEGSYGETSPAQREFEENPAHKFWQWDVDAQQWYHREECGSILYFPLEFD